MGREASPRPWRREAEPADRGKIRDANGELVCADDWDWGLDELDAALIIRAVNAHDDLLAACKALLLAHELGTTIGPGTAEAARAAIAKATGQV